MRWLGTAFAVVATVLFTVLVASQMQRPLMYDDANFALAAKAVAETGLPFGNQGWMSERGDFSQREQWALWHPPLYVYILGLFAKLGGWTPAVLRAPGLLGGIATAGLTYVLARDLTRGRPRLAAGTAVALTMLCPLTVQSALIVDIDFSLLLPLSLLFVWLYLRLHATPRVWLTLAPLFALLLWTKMTNPLPLLAVPIVWQILRGEPKTAALHLLGIGGLGATLFGITWIAIGTTLGFPLDMPFGVNAVQWQDSAEVAQRAYTSPGAFIEGLQPTVLWLGPGLVSLGLAAVAVRCGQLAQIWEFRKIEVLTGLVILLAVGYVYKSAGWFPKYQVTLVPLLACLGAPLVAHAWCVRPRLTAGIATACALAGAVVEARLVRDEGLLQRTWAMNAEAAPWLLGAIAFAALVATPWRFSGPAAAAGLAGLAIGWMVATDAMHASAAYATTYWYGTTGTTDAALWVDAHITANETYVAAKEVAIRARNQRYVDQDNLVYLFGTGRTFDGTWQTEPVRAVVAWQREPYVADLLKRGVSAANYVESARFGDYVVYEPGQMGG
ncbi:MAG TPA: glycosyltransferase family 39 protein, partial [Chloroflexota bacterium]